MTRRDHHWLLASHTCHRLDVRCRFPSNHRMAHPGFHTVGPSVGFSSSQHIHEEPGYGAVHLDRLHPMSPRCCWDFPPCCRCPSEEPHSFSLILSTSYRWYRCSLCAFLQNRYSELTLKCIESCTRCVDDLKQSLGIVLTIIKRTECEAHVHL